MSEMADGTCILERPDHCSACDTERDLPRTRFQPRGLNHADLASKISKALSLDPPQRTPILSTPLLPLGTFDRGPSAVPAFLALTSDFHDPSYAAIVEPLKAPCALILPAPHAEELTALRNRGLWVFRAASLLQVWPKGQIKGITTLATALTDYLAGTEIRPAHPSLTRKGSRYVIADDYSAVTEIARRRRTEPISNTTTQAALRVLVEAGAGNLGTALPKALFVERVHTLTRPDKPPPKSPRPSHYFRREVDGALVNYAFYRQIFRTNPSGGLYWLEF